MTGERFSGAEIRVLLVDDHELVREGLTERLQNQPDIEVVGAVATVEAAVDCVISLDPDVAVLDVQLPDGNGIDLCRRIKAISPSTQCIIHAGTELEPDTAVNTGAAAVVLKQLAGDQLLESIRKAAATGR